MDGTGWDKVEELRQEMALMSKELGDALEFIVWLRTYQNKDVVIDLRLQGLFEKLTGKAA